MQIRGILLAISTASAVLGVSVDPRHNDVAVSAYGMPKASIHRPIRAAQASRQSSEHLPTESGPSATLLSQLITPLKTILISVLKTAEARLENADPKNIADILRGPMDSLKAYLVSIWPDVPPQLPGTAPVATHF
ncbi:hypothetical protein LPJ78_002722 [Coemansia sp. RSA 989]|nr:hypothetical protein LPJ78_002722 [Coemansia sp. RSA 989]